MENKGIENNDHVDMTVSKLAPSAEAKDNANADAEGNTTEGTYAHKFKNPFTYEGRTYTEILFDYNSMSGADIIAIDTEMQVKGEIAVMPEVSRNFQCTMAAKAGNIGTDVIMAMPAGDFMRIVNSVRNFLTSTGY